jgi:hypothetical protein
MRRRTFLQVALGGLISAATVPALAAADASQRLLFTSAENSGTDHGFFLRTNPVHPAAATAREQSPGHALRGAASWGRGHLVRV